MQALVLTVMAHHSTAMLMKADAEVADRKE